MVVTVGVGGGGSCETGGKKETESGYILEIEPTRGRGGNWERNRFEK